MTLVAVGAFMHRSARGSAAALAGGLAVLLAGVTFGSALAPVAAAVPAPASPGGGGSAQLSWVHFSWGPLFSGGVDPTRRCTPVRESPCRRKPHASRSVPRPGSPGPVGPPWRAAGVLIVSVLGLLAVVWVALSGLPWVLVIVPALAALLLGTYAARVVIDQSAARASLRLTWLKVALDDIDHASVGTVSPIREFGGWGSRVAIDGRRGYVTRAGEALIVRRLGQSDVVVTLEGEEAAAVPNTLAPRVG